MTRIFISYRREDGSAWAGRLYDRLNQHFGQGNVFMDIDTIEPGVDFGEAIERAVAACDVFIALIGRQWLTATDPAGQRRLDNPDDFVRLEIVAALQRNIRVIPALIQGTPMPRTPDLPEALQGLVRRNALEISDTRFHVDVDRLIGILQPRMGDAAPKRPATPPPLRRHMGFSTISRELSSRGKAIGLGTGLGMASGFVQVLIRQSQSGGSPDLLLEEEVLLMLFCGVFSALVGAVSGTNWKAFSTAVVITVVGAGAGLGIGFLLSFPSQSIQKAQDIGGGMFVGWFSGSVIGGIVAAIINKGDRERKMHRNH